MRGKAAAHDAGTTRVHLIADELRALLRLTYSDGDTAHLRDGRHGEGSR